MSQRKEVVEVKYRWSSTLSLFGRGLKMQTTGNGSGHINIFTLFFHCLALIPPMGSRTVIVLKEVML